MTPILIHAKRLAVCTALASLPVLVGCERPSGHDRAEYSVYERRDRDEESNDEAAAAEDRSAEAKSRTYGSKNKSRNDAAPALRQESTTVATPIPARVISTAEAESPVRYVTYADGATLGAASAVPSAADCDAKLRQAEEHNRAAAAAAARGTWFTARAEFTQAAQLTAAALDAREGLARRSEALQRAFVALTEAEEFSKSGGAGASGEALAVIVRGHQTFSLLRNTSQPTSAALHDAYCRYAERQLCAAFAGYERASVALHGLGKVCAASGSSIIDFQSKACCLYEAALTVAPGNVLASNDLAVLLADAGRLEQARDVLHAGLRQTSQPAMWNNLAVIHDRMGQAELAQLARREAGRLEKIAATSPGSVLPTHNVSWLNAQGFAATGRPPVDAQVASPNGKATVQAMSNAAPYGSTPPSSAQSQPTEKTARQTRSPILAY